MLPWFVADRLGPDPPPAGTAVAGADHAGFDVVVDAGGDGAGPSLDDAGAVVGMKGFDPGFAFEIVWCEAEVVEEALVGVGELTVGRAHPDGLGIEVGEDAVAGLAGDEGVLVVLAVGDVDAEAAQAGGDAIDLDGVAPAFDPDDAAIGGAKGAVDDDHLARGDGLRDEIVDDRDVLGEDDLLEGIEIGSLGQGMAEDRVGAGAVGGFAGCDIDIPGGDARGLLDGGEQLLLEVEFVVGAPTLGDVAEEDDDAVGGGADLDGQPHVEWRGIVVLEVAGDALVHGAVEVIEVTALFEACGELLPDVFADEIALDGEQFAGAAVEEGEVAGAVDAGDGVGGGLEHLHELVGGCVAEKLGALAIGDIAEVDGDAFVHGEDVDIEPDIVRLAEVFDMGGNAGLHDGAIGSFELCAHHLRKELPMALVAQMGGPDPADSEGFIVCKGDAPLAVKADNRFGHLAEEAGQIVAPGVFGAPASALPFDGRFGVDGGRVRHKSGLPVLHYLT